MFLTSTLAEELFTAPGRMLMLASQRKLPSSMLAVETPRSRRMECSLTRYGAGLFGGAQVGLAHNLHQGHAGAVDIHQAVGHAAARRGGRSLAVSSSRCTRVMPMRFLRRSPRMLSQPSDAEGRRIAKSGSPSSGRDSGSSCGRTW